MSSDDACCRRFDRAVTLVAVVFLRNYTSQCGDRAVVAVILTLFETSSVVVVAEVAVAAEEAVAKVAPTLLLAVPMSAALLAVPVMAAVLVVPMIAAAPAAV